MIDLPLNTPHDIHRAIELLESSGFEIRLRSRILRERHLAAKEMEGKSTFTGRIGAHPDDIIAALRNSWRGKPAAVFTRAKRRRNEQVLRMRIDRLVNREYYSTYNRRFSTRKARRERALGPAAE